MKIGNVATWKVTGDVGVIVKIEENYAKIRYNSFADPDVIKRKISDWIPQDELDVKED